MTAKFRRLIITVLLLALLIFAFAGCAESKRYDVGKESAAGFLWENCFRETIEGKVMSAENSYYDGYLCFRFYLPSDMTFEQVQPLLEEMKQNVLEMCSDKTFEPYNSFLGEHYYMVYVELINPQSKRPSDYLRSAGQLAFYLGDFPIVGKEAASVVNYY